MTLQPLVGALLVCLVTNSYGFDISQAGYEPCGLQIVESFGPSGNYRSRLLWSPPLFLPMDAHASGSDLPMAEPRKPLWRFSRAESEIAVTGFESGRGIHRSISNDTFRAGQILAEDAAHIYTAPTRLNLQTAPTVVGVLAVGALVFAFDEEIYDAIQRHGDNRLLKSANKLGEALDTAGSMKNSDLFYFAFLVTGYLIGIDPVTRVSGEILESHLIAGIPKRGANVLLGRHRPYEGRGPYSFSFNEGTSFPSGHVSNFFQVSHILARHIRFLPFQIAVYSLPLASGIERLSSEQHWPSDIYYGAVFALAVSEAVVDLHERRTVSVSPSSLSRRDGFGVVVSVTF